MSDNKNQFIFNGEICEKMADGTLQKVVTKVSGEGIIDVTADDAGVHVSTPVLSVSDGLLCATFYQEEEV